MSVDTYKRRNAAAVLALAGVLGMPGWAGAQQPAEQFHREEAEGPVGPSEVAPPSEVEKRFAKFIADPLQVNTRDMNDGFSWAQDCSAQPSLDHALSLAEAVDLALCGNPQVKATWAAVKASVASLGEAKSTYLPTLAAGVSRVHDRTTYPGAGVGAQTLHDTSRNLSVSWRIFDFGTRNANQAAASALLSAAFAAHDAALQRLLEAVVSAYFDAQTAKSSWHSKQVIEELARQTLDAARRREATGASSQIDTLQASTALAKAGLERSRSAGDYAKAQAVLLYSLGLSPGTSIELADDLADSRDKVEQELAEWLSQAQAHHPAILAARAQVDAARQRVLAMKAEGLPTVDLGVNQYRNGRPNQGLSAIQTNERVLALTLSVPLFDGFARGYKTRNAQAQVEQKEAELADAEHQVLLNVVKAHADAVAALANLIASDDLLKAATLANASARRRMDKGAVDVLELLNAQAALADAELQHIRSLADWRSARLRLFATAGRLGRDQLVN